MDFVVLALTRSSTSSRYDKNLILKRNHQIHVVQAYSYSYVFHALLPLVCCAVLGRVKVCARINILLPVRAFRCANAQCVCECVFVYNVSYTEYDAVTDPIQYEQIVSILTSSIQR